MRFRTILGGSFVVATGIVVGVKARTYFDRKKYGSEWAYRASQQPEQTLREIGPNVWQASGTLMGLSAMRNMTVYRSPHTNELILHSVVALNDEQMKILESLGKVSIMIVPHCLHRADAPAYKERYPDIVVVAPKDGRKKVEALLKVDANVEDFFSAGNKYNVALLRSSMVAPTTEYVYDVPLSPKGDTRGLVMNDQMANVPRQDRNALVAALLDALGLGTDGSQPRVARTVKYFGSGFHPSNVKTALNEVAEHIEKGKEDGNVKPQYQLIALSHGAPVYDDLPAKLRKTVEQL